MSSMSYLLYVLYVQLLLPGFMRLSVLLVTAAFLVMFLTFFYYYL